MTLDRVFQYDSDEVLDELFGLLGEVFQKMEFFQKDSDAFLDKNFQKDSNGILDRLFEKHFN